MSFFGLFSSNNRDGFQRCKRKKHVKIRVERLVLSNGTVHQYDDCVCSFLSEPGWCWENGYRYPNVWDEKGNPLNNLRDKMDQLIKDPNEQEKYRNRPKLDLVFHDGPEGSFSYKASEEELFDGNLKALNPHRSRHFEEHKVEYIYHMTHYRNIESLMDFGLYPHGNSYVDENIDNEDVNALRQKHDPIYDQPLHKYVPFYFNHKNAMLYANLDKQEDIVILCIDPRVMLTEDAIFTDGNAASTATKFYDELDDLSELDWSCLRGDKWTHFEDGKRTKMAEVLVPEHVESKFIKKIICYDQATADYLETNADCDIIDIDTSFYFDSY
jgi:hypothetical protein